MQTPIKVEVNLKSKPVQAHLLKILLVILKLVPFDTNIKENKLKMILNIIILASATKSSINATCLEHKGTPSGVTVRNTLKLIFTDIETVETMLNRVLKSTIKRKHLRGLQQVNSDLIEVEYYGQPDENEDEIRKGKKNKGTHSFHAYATVYVYVKEQRYTLAITYVRAHDSMLDVLQRLNRYLLGYAFRPSLWLLDRGYYCVEVIKWFRRHNKGFIMPVQLRGRKPKHKKGPTGTYKYKTWTKSGWDEYTLTNKKRTDKVTTDIAVVVTYPKGPGQYKDPKVLIYACFKVKYLRTRRILELYKRRFAIETSHRQARQAKAKTTTRHPGLRYAMIGISFILRNVWISLHFHILYEKRRGPGGRRICRPKLTFGRMLKWLRHSIELIFPLILEEEVEEPARIQFLRT